MRNLFSTGSVLCVLFVLWAVTDQAALSASTTDIGNIVADGKLLVAITKKDYPPLFFTNSRGELEGTEIERVRDMARSLHVRAEFLRTARSFDDIIDLLSKGEAELGIGTTMTLPRAQKVLFSGPYLTLKMAILFNRLVLVREEIYSDVEDLGQMRDSRQKIGLLAGSAYRGYAEKTFPLGEIVDYASLETLYGAVLSGEIMGAVSNDLITRLYFRQNPTAAIRLQLFVDKTAKDRIAFAVPPDFPHFLAWLNAYITLNELTLDSHQIISSVASSD